MIKSSLNQFVELICEKNPFQKKMVNIFLQTRDEQYWQRAEDFCSKMLIFLESQGISVEFVVDSYLQMCRDMVMEQIKYKKTGKYSASNISEVYQEVYSSEIKMTSYMYGLGLSQFLWPHHYDVFDFFLAQNQKLDKVERYLEVGPGHGLFLYESMKRFPEANFTAVDISPISIKITEDFTRRFCPDIACHYVQQDARNLSEGTFDYIVFCEVLEHLECPVSMLESLRDSLEDDGSFFVSTCCNCPAIDHIYHFKNVEHIRQIIALAGLYIEDEIVSAVDVEPDTVWNPDETEAIYAALLRKKR